METSQLSIKEVIVGAYVGFSTLDDKWRKDGKKADE
jgi:hypothetical protein